MEMILNKPTDNVHEYDENYWNWNMLRESKKGKVNAIETK